MEEKKKNILKDWKLWVGVAIIAVSIISVATIFILSNKMTPEETVSKFMYLIENKEYEKAKSLCSTKMEKLDVLSNIKPSNLTFDFTEDKKSAKAIILEEEIQSTNLNIIMTNTLLGWKIQSYEVIDELIEPEVLESRLKDGKALSDVQLLYWGESDIASKDEIAEYVKDNAMVALIFAETMKAQKYYKANELYTTASKNDLTVEELKEYDWNNYELISNFELINNLNTITIQVKDKKLWIYVAGKQIVSVMNAKT